MFLSYSTIFAVQVKTKHLQVERQQSDNSGNMPLTDAQPSLVGTDITNRNGANVITELYKKLNLSMPQICTLFPCGNRC